MAMTDRRTGVIHYSWSDVYSIMGTVSFPDYEITSFFTVSPLKRTKDYPRGRMAIRAWSAVSSRQAGCSFELEYTGYVSLTRKPNMADEVHAALTESRSRAREELRRRQAQTSPLPF